MSLKVRKAHVWAQGRYFILWKPTQSRAGQPGSALLQVDNVCCVKSLSCPTLCDPMDWSPPGSSVHGILQARMLEWVAMLSSRGSFRPRDQTWVSCVSCFFPIGRWVLYHQRQLGSSGGQWVGLFQTQGGCLYPQQTPQGHRLLSFLLFSHLKPCGSLCFYSEGKGVWAQLSEMWIRGQTGSIRKSLSDLSHLWTVETLCWTKRHNPSPAPSQPAKVN